MPVAKVRAKLITIRDQRLRLEAEMEDIATGLDIGAQLIDAALDIAQEPYELYRRMVVGITDCSPDSITEIPQLLSGTASLCRV
jgi:hypothetical protein